MFANVLISRRKYAGLGLLLIFALVFISVIFLAPQSSLNAVSDPVIAAAGDIACDPASSSFRGGIGGSTYCHQKLTADLMVNAHLSAVLALGDTQYYCGGYDAYLKSYALSWGRLKSITHPVIGNHEYLTYGGTGCTPDNEGAEGYYKYFGGAAGPAGKGYYSFDVGKWHLIALNSNCATIGGCSASSPQGRWLQSDLLAHKNKCVLAYWHIPLFSSGGRDARNTQPLWQLLYNSNADIILGGHDHIYERFAPMSPDGNFDPLRGIRSFVVGTGGASHTSIGAISRFSEARSTSTFGVLMLTLHSSSYEWRFVPEAGKSFTDSGSNTCH